MNKGTGSTISLAGMRHVCGALTLLCLVTYLANNVFSTIATVVVGQASVAMGWLAVAGVLAMCGYLLRSLEVGRLTVYRSSLILLGFLIYFLLNLLVTVLDSQYAKALTIGTSGGVLFSYVLGLIGYSGIQCVLASGKHGRGFFVGALVSAVVWFAIASVFFGYFTVGGNLQSDVLLIVDNFGYQRRGDFLSVMFLLVSGTVVGLVQGGGLKRSFTGRFVQLATVGGYALSIPLWLYVGQLVGSNSEVMVVGGLSLPSMAFLIIGLRSGDGGGAPLTLKRVIVVGMAALAAILVVVIAATIYFHVDITQLRLFNFGEGGSAPTSVSSRLALLARDYLAQVNYDPLFGNMNVEILTTGVGTYAHSLPLSLISHLGIVGFWLFVAFLSARMREIRLGGTWTATFFPTALQSANYRLYVLLTLWAVVVMASLTAFFVWMPLWFALGLLIPPIAMQRCPSAAGSCAALSDVQGDAR